MISSKNYIKYGFLLFLIFILVFFSFAFKLTAEDIKWKEVFKTSNELLLIAPQSIKYNNRGYLSVITKYYEINPEDQILLNSDLYLMAIDCENRLFSKLPLDGDLNQVKNWENPINNKMIKKSIINSCSF